LFAALALIKEQRLDIYDRTLVKLIGGFGNYGSYTQKDLGRLQMKYGIAASTVEVMPPVPYVESLALMRLSDCLIAIDPPEPYFIAMKVIDYAGADKPIIAIAPKESSTAEVVTGLGFRSFAYDEAAALADYLIGLASGEAPPHVDEAFRERYSVERTTSDLIQVLRDAAGSVPAI
jgi:hypothetical protein